MGAMRKVQLLENPNHSYQRQVLYTLTPEKSSQVAIFKKR